MPEGVLIKNREARNASWIIICKVIQTVLNYVISSFTAKFLGPSRYGLTYYAASVTAFLIPVCLLGLSDIMVRELVENPDREGEILGTSLLMSLGSSVTCMGLMVLFVSATNRGDREAALFCALYSISMLFQGMELLSAWFQSKLMSRYTSTISLCAFVLVAAYKAYLLFSSKNIYWFAFSNALDYALITIPYFVFYKRNGGQKLSFSSNTAGRLLGNSKYYILTNVMVVSFTATDKIMLRTLASAEEEGIYSAAFSVATVSSFVFSAIITSARPGILKAAVDGDSSFGKKMTVLFSIVIWLSVAQNFFFSVFGKSIIEIMYGEEYLSAVPVLRIVCWYTTFSYLGSARNVWILGSGNQKELWKVNLIGACIGLTLNYILIRRFGMTGAAIAAVVTQSVTNILTGYIIKRIRPVSSLIIKALDIRNIRDFVQFLSR